MNKRGGKRPGAGRKPGSVTKRTKARIALADKAIDAGITPLAFMLDVMRQPIEPDTNPLIAIAIREQRFEAAKAAAPYCHNRLAAIEHTGKDGVPLVPPVIEWTVNVVHPK